MVVTGEVPPAVARRHRKRRGGVAEATVVDRKAFSVGRRPRTPARRVRIDGRTREGWWVIIAESEAETKAN